MQHIEIFKRFPNLTAGLFLPDEDLPHERVTLHQLHGNLVHEVERGLPEPSNGDGLITHDAGHLLTMRVADCAAILVYDPTNHTVAAIHSGWRGTKVEIVPKAIARLKQQYGSKAANLIVYVSPLAQPCHYEVQADFLPNFDSKYFKTRDGKHFFDNQAVIRDQLHAAGVTDDHIQLDGRCTIHDSSFPSYRRDHTSQRMLVAIGMKA